MSFIGLLGAYTPYIKNSNVNVKELLATITPYVESVVAMIEFRSLSALVILILLDMCLGIAASIKQGIGFDSGIGRHGLINKSVEVLVCLTFNILGSVAPSFVPLLLVTGLYSFFILFELSSIVENLGLIGYKIPVLSNHIKLLKEQQEKDEGSSK